MSGSLTPPAPVAWPGQPLALSYYLKPSPAELAGHIRATADLVLDTYFGDGAGRSLDWHAGSAVGLMFDQEPDPKPATLLTELVAEEARDAATAGRRPLLPEQGL